MKSPLLDISEEMSAQEPLVTSSPPEDRREARTRAALREAFVSLALSRRWSQLTVADIVERANAGRSTFYEHYRGKDDLLRDVIGEPLAVLAASIDAPDASMLTPVMSHFWENRAIGNAMLAGAPRLVLTKLLRELIETRMRARPRHALSLPLPAPLLAAYLASGQIAVLAGWLGGQASATPKDIAEGLVTLARAVTTSPS